MSVCLRSHHLCYSLFCYYRDLLASSTLYHLVRLTWGRGVVYQIQRPTQLMSVVTRRCYLRLRYSLTRINRTQITPLPFEFSTANSFSSTTSYPFLIASASSCPSSTRLTHSERVTLSNYEQSRRGYITSGQNRHHNIYSGCITERHHSRRYVPHLYKSRLDGTIAREWQPNTFGP